MWHKNRRFRITTCTDLHEVVDQLANHSQVLCKGFKVSNLLILNDSTSEDGAQEYAVVRDGVQIESLTVSWMTAERLYEVLSALDADASVGAVMGQLTIKTHEAGECCRHCA